MLSTISRSEKHNTPRYLLTIYSSVLSRNSPKPRELSHPRWRSLLEAPSTQDLANVWVTKALASHQISVKGYSKFSSSNGTG